jgi:hypothetical protein
MTPFTASTVAAKEMPLQPLGWEICGTGHRRGEGLARGERWYRSEHSGDRVGLEGASRCASTDDVSITEA